LAKNNIERHYKRFLKLGAVKLNIRIPAELVPNPKNYTEKASLPMQQSILVREENLNHDVNYAWNCILWIEKFSKQENHIPVTSAMTERIPCSS
jgi:hypothetical protein